MMIDTIYPKKMLELSERDFYKFYGFITEFEVLKSEKEFSFPDFEDACNYVLGKSGGFSFIYKKEYRDFASKHKFFIDYFYDILDKFYYHSYHVEMYEYLKENFCEKDSVLLILNRLIDLKIYTFDFRPCETFNKDLEITIKKSPTNEVVGFSTDGKMTFGPRKKVAFEWYCYPVSLTDASYVIKYRKEEGLYNKVKMVVSGLLFDIDTLPTYEELYDITVFPYVDYFESMYKTMLLDQLCYADEILVFASDIMDRLKTLGKIRGMEIVDSNIEEINKFYSDIENLKDLIFSEVLNNTLMDEDKVQRVLKRNRDIRHYR